MKFKGFCIELYLFFMANLKSTVFGAYLLTVLMLAKVFEFEFISRYDLIFLAAITFQLVFLIFKLEKLKEFGVIFLFHIVATLMELFKTNPEIGSWSYPYLDETFFKLATVPLFTGFLYSAVGSYMSRAQRFLNLEYENFPKKVHLWTASICIYINFFTHHYIYDFRYILLVYLLYIFRKTIISFKVYKKRRGMNLLCSTILVSLFMWIAENIGTMTKTWLYPHQNGQWELVSIQKMGSWFLLLILSFALVSLVYEKKIYKNNLQI